jgi:hypothetical protein
MHGGLRPCCVSSTAAASASVFIAGTADACPNTSGYMTSRERDGSSEPAAAKKAKTTQHSAQHDSAPLLETIRAQLIEQIVKAMKATALKSRKGKKASAWVDVRQAHSLKTLQTLLGGRGICTKSTSTAYHVQLTGDDIAAVLPDFPQPQTDQDSFGWKGGAQCLWQGPVRIPKDEPYGVYYVQASIVTAEMRWSASGLKARVFAVRTCQITGRAPV